MLFSGRRWSVDQPKWPIFSRRIAVVVDGHVCNATNCKSGAVEHRVIHSLETQATHSDAIGFTAAFYHIGAGCALQGRAGTDGHSSHHAAH